MLTPLDRKLRYIKIQEVFRIRAKNLRVLVEGLGGFHPAARLTGKSIASLQQICLDEHPWHRSIGDTMARELELVLRLKPGSLDIKHSPLRR
jgi:hypothetical protein